MFVPELRDLLPAAREYVFLNYAATAPMLKPSVDKMLSVIREGIEPLSLHFDNWLALVESSRKIVAGTIGANVDEITFTTNTSMALSLIAASMDWKAGDRIVFPSDEFPSNRFVWENLSRKGVKSEHIEIGHGLDFADQLSKMDLTSVRLVSISSVSYSDGRRCDIERLVRLCHQKDILVAVDAIQAVGAIPVDVHQWGCDFLACGGQKWLLGPVGSGFLFINSSILKRLHVPMVGWASSRNAGDFDERHLEFVDGARRFEPGLPDVAAIAGLSESINTLSSMGWARIFSAIASHNNRLKTELNTLGFDLIDYGPQEAQSGIVMVNLSGDEESELIHKLCKRNRIILTLRNGKLRIAAHASTSDRDIDIFLNLMSDYRGKKRVFVDNTYSDFTTSARSMNKVRWKHALVTGASRGLGAAIAVALAKRGCNLSLIGRDQSRLETIAERIKKVYKVDVKTISLDLADRKAVEKWLIDNQTNLDFDVLINNAAIGEAGLFLESEIDRLHSVFEVNYFTPCLLTQKILPGMLERNSGAILNIVTSGSRCALPLFSGYASSKGALWAWSESLGREFAGKGITVTTFLPPHMGTATQNRLSRKALAYYKIGKSGSHTISPNIVAEQAVSSLYSGKSTVAPLATRFKLAINAIASGQITKSILKNWRGL